MPAPVSADHDQVVVVDGVVGILGGESRIDVRVLLDQLEVVAQLDILLQQSLEDIVLLAGLHNPVDGNVLFQPCDDGFGVGRECEYLGRAYVVMREPLRQSVCQKVDGDYDRQYHSSQYETVAAHPEGLCIE